ncbi:MAG: ArsB/NhaD family transporter [Pseudomonadota bacterium]
MTEVRRQRLARLFLPGLPALALLVALLAAVPAMASEFFGHHQLGARGARVMTSGQAAASHAQGMTDLTTEVPAPGGDPSTAGSGHVGEAAFWIALATLAGVYVLIAFDIIHRTLAALLGAALVLSVSYTAGTFWPDYFIMSFQDATAAIDWNVIFLLLGMMIIVGILKESGLFHWLAFKGLQSARGNAYLLVIVLMALTALLSALLDNVTTMLLLTPVAIDICQVLGLHPFAVLMPCVLASNFGGTATLIGDPPNIMIGSSAGLTFNDFLSNLGPLVVITLIAQGVVMRFYYGRQYRAATMTFASEEPVKKGKVRRRKMPQGLESRFAVSDYRLLVLGLAILALVVGLFVAHGTLHMEVSIAALLGAALLALLSGADIVRLLQEDVEWPTLVFFMMLFVVVGAAERVGLLKIVADWITLTSSGNLVAAILIVAWASAIISAIIDNIPFTATMLPVVAYLTRTIPGAENMVLWYALALGACFGGNATLIGASANVVTADLLAKAGHPVSFRYFLKVGFPVMVLGMVLGSLWLVLVLR